MIGGGGRVSTFRGDEAKSVVDTGFSGGESEGISVEDESRVDFLETAVDVDQDSAVAYGFAYEAKFLNDASDMRGAFQGNRRITIQL